MKTTLSLLSLLLLTSCQMQQHSGFAHRLQGCGYTKVVFQGNAYSAEDLKEEKGCASFVDERLREQKVCGDYRIQYDVCNWTPTSMF